ncbi:hypothetical protein ABPG74_014486 [Tetrahymena malaccensis]
MENKDIFSCLKMLQNSINYNIAENLQKLQDKKVDQNIESQLCFIEIFKEQIINDICSITDLIICKIEKHQNFDKNEKFISTHYDQHNQELIQDGQKDKTLSNQQEQSQKQVALISVEEEDESDSEIKKNKKKKDSILKKEQIYYTIYQQFLNSYDPIKRNKSQIINYLSEQTGWSFSTIQNIIRKFELKKVNPIIYKNQTKVFEFMQQSQFQGLLGKRRTLQINDKDCNMNDLNNTDEVTSQLLKSGYSISIEKQSKKTIKQEFHEQSNKFIKSQE